MEQNAVDQKDYKIFISKKESIKKYLRFNTYRITFLSFALALNLVLAVFSHYVLGLVPLFNFLVIEITFFSYLIVFYTINEFYAIIMIFLCSWIRLLMFPESGAWVGVLSLNLSDLFEFLFFIFFYYIFKNFIKFKSYVINEMILISLSLFLSTVFNAGLNCLWNYTFLVKMYSQIYGSTINALINNNWTIYLASNFAFNLLKYFINSLLFLGVLKFLIVLNKKY